MATIVGIARVPDATYLSTETTHEIDPHAGHALCPPWCVRCLHGAEPDASPAARRILDGTTLHNGRKRTVDLLDAGSIDEIYMYNSRVDQRPDEAEAAYALLSINGDGAVEMSAAELQTLIQRLAEVHAELTGGQR